ncbi:MAG TPA: glycosyltransferase [Candidatus Dormibacteraeota bacterium]|jgi:cellulose synthase/poly-beta-1,6-N-acetylglucosamine synthase-like glycosyltransferase|nr:glycosyltransferase [Candidatus Dormibacteraeota bacterium]
MIAELVTFFGLLCGVATVLVVGVPGAVRAQLWFGLPLAVVAVACSGVGVALLAGDPRAGEVMAVVALALGIALKGWLRHWSLMATLLLAAIIVAGLAYLSYSLLQAAVDPLGPVVWAGTGVLFLLELTALGLTVSYAFEVLDVLSRQEQPPQPLPTDHRPMIAIQVPTYNEPVAVVSRTLHSLARLDYANFIVQVVDNNTKDPAVWRPLEALCRRLGPRFQFMHLEPWPGFKAGALNEATRRLPRDVEVIGIVDADYVVNGAWLRHTAGHFADPEVAFVQTPQHYREWQDDPYLRGLFYSYRYFFDITMPCRANRNAIIFAGTMGLIRRTALERIGGWSTETVTEDAEASLRLLGAGYRGVYVHAPYGEGLMPLSFAGLKKQRFRWALGGIQILRMHWRELLPFAPHRLRLTSAQRIHYMLGAVQWFGDLLNLTFTLLLLVTAAATIMHHRLPVREIVGPLTVVPILFLVTGIGRALWAIRTTARCTWGDSIRCLRCWFALSWVVSLACLRGLVRRRAAFLRTPKDREGRSVWQAIMSSRTETVIAILAVLAAVAMPIADLAPTTIVLSLLLLWMAALYTSAPWAGFAAEGIRWTPQRREFLRSPQNTGDRPHRSIPPALLLAGPAAVVVVVLAAFVASLPPTSSKPPPTVDLPKVSQPTPTPTAVPTPRPHHHHPTPAPTPTPTSTPQPTPSPTTASGSR